MVGRYTLTATNETIKNELGIDPTSKYAPIFNAAPTKLLPVLTHEHSGGFSFFYWGLPPEMTKTKPVAERLINADQSQLTTKASYRNSLVSRRCMVPADGFYIWQKVSKKGIVPYRFVFDNERIFFIAGLWEKFDISETKTAHTFTIITAGIQDKGMGGFPEALPSMISPKKLDQWMNPGTKEEDLLTLIETPNLNDFRYYPVSSRINDVKLDNPQLIEPTKPMDQFGNYSLFD